MNDLGLVRFFTNKENYLRFRKYVKSHTILRDTETLIEDVGEYWKMYPDKDTVDWAHFEMWFNMVRHPTWEAERKSMYASIFTRVRALEDVDASVINNFIQLDYTSQVRDVCDRIIRGDPVRLDSIHPILDRFVGEVGTAGKTDEDYFVTNNLRDILDDILRSGGVDWRLEDLNVGIGPLHPGDFVVVGARPETGKTTFIVSEFTHMVQQLPEDQDAIIFNNEEDGRKIFARLVQAALGCTLLDIAADETKAEEKYVALLKRLDRIKVVHKDTPLTIYDIDRFLKTGKYGLVGINVLDKMGGYDKDEHEVSRLRSVAQYIRQMAVRHKTIIVAVMQADASAEGKAWLDQSQLYGTKTGVQGEADAIIMVGAQGEEDTRYVSIVKNKLPGGPRTEASKRHGKFEVRFDPERARYASKFY